MFKKKKQFFVVLFLVVILSISMTGCDFLNGGSSSKTGIEGKLTLKGEPLTNVKIMAGQYITHTNSNGEFEILTDQGEYDVVMKNLFNEDTKKSVYVEDGKMVEINRSYTFKDLDIADDLFLQEDKYYRPTGREEPDENGDYGMWDTTTIFEIMDGVGSRWPYGKITYSYSKQVPDDAKNNIDDFLQKISDKLNNVITFKKVSSDGDMKFIEKTVEELNAVSGYAQLHWNRDYYITGMEIIINEEHWQPQTYNHEIMHGLGLLGNAHLPEKNKTGSYDGTEKLMFWLNNPSKFPSKEVWNSLKLKYSVEPTNLTKPKWASPILINNENTPIIEE